MYVYILNTKCRHLTKYPRILIKCIRIPKGNKSDYLGHEKMHGSECSLENENMERKILNLWIEDESHLKANWLWLCFVTFSDPTNW